MNRVLVCFLVVGTSVSLGAEVAYDNVGTETKEVSSKVSSSSLSSILDKRGATRITNTDNPGFNHLTTSNTASSTGFKPSSSPATNTPPFKYLYNQFYQPNPYLTYFQFPQAAQIAAQYAYQPNPIAHYLQTPTQIQYVSTPTVAQVQQPVKYQTFTGDYSNAVDKTATSSSAQYAAPSQTSSQYATSISSAQYAAPSQTSSQYATSGAQYVAPSQVSSQYTTTAQASASSASVSPSKQVQVPFYTNFQTAQPFYYQQPFYFVMQPQAAAANFLYQQPNANFLLKQQLLNYNAGNRFAFYTPTQSNQLTYTVPIAVAPSAQDQTTTTTDTKTSDKTATSSSSSSSYSYGTKA